MPLPHSHKPETGSLPACLATRTPSLPPSASLPCLTVSLFPFFCLGFACWVSPFFSAVSVWFCAFRIIGLQSYSQRVNHVVPCHCLSSAHSPLTFLVCMHLSSTHCGLVIAVSTQAAFPFNCSSLGYIFCTYILLFWPHALTTFPLIYSYRPVHYKQGDVSKFKKVAKGSLYSSWNSGPCFIGACSLAETQCKIALEPTHF